MRNASESDTQESGETRLTVVAPRPLVEDFRAIARSRDLTLSQELRRLMREYVEREAA